MVDLLIAAKNSKKCDKYRRSFCFTLMPLWFFKAPNSRSLAALEAFNDDCDASSVIHSLKDTT